MAQIKEKYFDHLGDDFERFMDDYDVLCRCGLIFHSLLRDVDISNNKVLEVGCGTGRISCEIISRKADLTVLDIGENLVHKVTSKLGCQGVVGDACQLPFESGAFDVIISSECIEHTLYPVKAIQEMCRVCRPGGIVCFTSPNKLWYPILWLSVKTRIRCFRGIENWLFPYQAASAMKHSNIDNIRFSGCHLWPFQLKFTRPVLKWIDRIAGSYLYRMMINYGIRGTKKS